MIDSLLLRNIVVYSRNIFPCIHCVARLLFLERKVQLYRLTLNTAQGLFAVEMTIDRCGKLLFSIMIYVLLQMIKQ